MLGNKRIIHIHHDFIMWICKICVKYRRQKPNRVLGESSLTAMVLF